MVPIDKSEQTQPKTYAICKLHINAVYLSARKRTTLLHDAVPEVFYNHNNAHTHVPHFSRQ